MSEIADKEPSTRETDTPKTVGPDAAPALAAADIAQEIAAGRAEDPVPAPEQRREPAAIDPDPMIAHAQAPLPPGATGILTINLAAIVANWRKLSKKIVSAECAAVVKADAYGCGADQVTRALARAGCKTFFVATHDEAHVVRKAAPDAIIYVLNGFLGHGDALAESNARPVISDFNELAEWEAFRQVSGWRGEAALHIDTGLNRLGLPIADAAKLLARFRPGDHGLTLVMSHLACAETVNHAMNAKQLGAFREMAGRFSGLSASLANSSGIFLGSSYGFDLLRPGAALYGVNPTPEADNPMLPAVDLRARILQVRHVERGDSVGYGATWTARRPTRLAIVAAGYADGFFRSAGARDGSKGADVIVAGKRCPVAGRISMDLTAVDVTDLPANAAKRGDTVTLIGDGITLDELAYHFGTIGYEVLTSLGRRYTRAYVGDEL
jgi:alanine racemase